MSSIYLPDQVLWLVGAGNLGARIGQIWRARFPRGLVMAETQSTLRHSDLKDLGLKPFTASERPPAAPSHCVVAVPPQGLPDHGSMYELEMRLKKFLPPAAPLVWISSIAVYSEEAGGEVTEDAEVGRTPRAVHLLALERLAQRAHPQTQVLRLAGLYSSQRGPHLFYRRVRKVEGRSNAWMNLIHEQDAAELAVAALLRGRPGQIYIGSDGNPIRRSEMVTRANGKLDHLQFTEDSEGLGKRVNSDRTLSELGIHLDYPEFRWLE